MFYETRGFGPDGPQPAVRGERVKKVVSRVGGVECVFVSSVGSYICPATIDKS